MVVHDHHDLAAAHVHQVGALLVSGELVAVEDRYAGLAEAPAAFARLMSGANVGKVLLDL
jgi:NADPH-dependent curcumin reductase CurA